MPNPIRRRRLLGQPFPMLAAQFVGASSQNLNITDGSQTGLDPGTSDFSLAFWVNPDNLAALQCMVGKGSTSNFDTNTSPGYEALLATNGQIQVILSDTANATRLQMNSNVGVITAGAWYQVTVSFTRASNINFYVNGVAQGSGAISTRSGTIDTTAGFALGSSSSNAGAFASFLTGRLDMVGFWARALSAAEAVTLTNGGLGLAYRELPSSLRANLVSWWDLDGTGNDALNVNPLTNRNGVTFGAGKR